MSLVVMGQRRQSVGGCRSGRRRRQYVRHCSLCRCCVHTLLLRVRVQVRVCLCGARAVTHTLGVGAGTSAGVNAVTWGHARAVARQRRVVIISSKDKPVDVCIDINVVYEIGENVSAREWAIEVVVVVVRFAVH